MLGFAIKRLPDDSGSCGCSTRKSEHQSPQRVPRQRLAGTPHRRWLAILALVPLSGLAGCGTFRAGDNAVAEYEQARRQQLWWEQSQNRAQYVAGRGYFHPETQSYHDARGRTIGQSDGPIQPTSFESTAPETDVDPRGDLGALGPASLLGAVRRISGQTPNRERAQNLYREGQTAFREAFTPNVGDKILQLSDAATKYEEAAQAWPDSALEEDALFKIAECHYFADRYPSATDAYAKLISAYTNTRHLDLVDARRFEVAWYWLQLHEADPKRFIQPNVTDRTRPRFDTFGNAIKLFDQIRIDDPTGKLADDATMAAANAYFEKGKYRRADELYTDLREVFPSSEHQFQAHLLGLKCKLLEYQGPDYDKLPLEEAENLVLAIQRLFPQENMAHREYIERAHGEVRAQMAERDLHMARYYERRGEVVGASHYYGLVLNNYPSTKLAQVARQRLAQIGNQADASERFSWIRNLFSYPDPNNVMLASDPSTAQRR